MYAIEVEDLHKSYGSVKALSGLSFRVAPGEIYGLIGPNGAGKTTTLKILAGLLRPDRGCARIYGYDVVKQRVEALKLVGYVPENPVLFQNLTLEEFVVFVAALRGLRKEDIVDDLNHYLEIFDLRDKRNKLLSTLSRGMMQKALVIAALVVRPKVLILDEPMSGMDPESQYVFKEEIRKLASKGVAIVISSHLLDMVEKLCTRVGIIHRGKMVAEGSVEEIKRMASAGTGGTLEEVFLKIVRSGQSP